MKRVLVSGATGFIGRLTLPMLLEKGYEVHGISCHRDIPEARGIRWHRADLLDSDQVSELIPRIAPTHLLHLAWNATPGVYLSTPDNVAWLRSGLQLMQLFEQSGGERFVGAGTCFEYDGDYGYCREHVTPIKPSSLYGSCKHALQLTLSSLSQQASFTSAWGRIFFLYGPHEYQSRLVPSVIRALLRGEQAQCSSGSQIRDFLHVQDVAGAFVALLESDATGPINIASGKPISLADLIRTIGRQLERPDLIALGALPDRANEPRVLLGDVSRLTSEIGFVPEYDLETGIQDAISWWRHPPSHQTPS